MIVRSLRSEPLDGGPFFSPFHVSIASVGKDEEYGVLNLFSPFPAFKLSSALLLASSKLTSRPFILEGTPTSVWSCP